MPRSCSTFISIIAPAFHPVSHALWCHEPACLRRLYIGQHFFLYRSYQPSGIWHLVTCATPPVTPRRWSVALGRQVSTTHFHAGARHYLVGSGSKAPRILPLSAGLTIVSSSAASCADLQYPSQMRQRGGLPRRVPRERALASVPTKATIDETMKYALSWQHA